MAQQRNLIAQETASISKSEAQNLFEDIVQRIKRFNQDGSIIRERVYRLISTNAYIVLGYKNLRELLKNIEKETSLHRSTINDYKNAAQIEIELNLEHGEWDTEALLTLKKDTTQEDRKSIIDLVEQSKRRGRNRSRSSSLKDMVIHAKKVYKNDRTKSINQDNSFIADDKNNLTLPVKSKNRPGRKMNTRSALKLIQDFSVQDREELIELLSPKSKIGRVAYLISHLMTHEEIEEFVKGLKHTVKPNRDATRRKMRRKDQDHF